MSSVQYLPYPHPGSEAGTDVGSAAYLPYPPRPARAFTDTAIKRIPPPLPQDDRPSLPAPIPSYVPASAPAPAPKGAAPPLPDFDEGLYDVPRELPSRATAATGRSLSSLPPPPLPSSRSRAPPPLPDDSSSFGFGGEPKGAALPPAPPPGQSDSYGAPLTVAPEAETLYEPIDESSPPASSLGRWSSTTFGSGLQPSATIRRPAPPPLPEDPPAPASVLARGQKGPVVPQIPRAQVVGKGTSSRPAPPPLPEDSEPTSWPGHAGVSLRAHGQLVLEDPDCGTYHLHSFENLSTMLYLH
jgi:hypothetical protein